MAHLTCQGHVRSEVDAILADYRAGGVENIMALGGDPPEDEPRPSSDYRYALELVEHVAASGHFSIGVAAHPEVHPSSPDRESDRRHLAAKLEVADFAITQFFFEAHHYVRLVGELAVLGIDKPVVPGIMPITNAKQIARMAKMSGAEMPVWVVDAINGAGDAADVRAIGVDIASHLCAELLEAGAPGLHFYTMNRSTATREIYANLGLGVSSG